MAGRKWISTGLMMAALFAAAGRSEAAQSAAKSYPQVSRGPQFAFADSSFVVVVPPLHGLQPATLLRSGSLAVPTVNLMRVSDPSFSDVAEGSMTPGLSPSSTPGSGLLDSPPKSWGHVLAGLGMMIFVALRRSVSL